MTGIFSEIHCPRCGEFRATVPRKQDRCPECGDTQAIILVYTSPIPRYLERIADMQE